MWLIFICMTWIFCEKIVPSLLFPAAVRPQTFWYSPGRVATAYSTDKYKNKISWVGQSTTPPQAPVPAQLSGIKHHTSTHLCLQGMICKLILQYVQKVSQMNSQNLEDAYISAVLASLRKIKSTLDCKLSTIRICVMCQCFKTAILPSLSRV